MNWGNMRDSLKDAIYEHKGRNELVPGVLRQLEEWIKVRIDRHSDGSFGEVDGEDLTLMFLLLSGK